MEQFIQWIESNKIVYFVVGGVAFLFAAKGFYSALIGTGVFKGDIDYD